MTLSSFFHRCVITLGLAAAAISPAHAQIKGGKTMDYGTMCVQAAEMPKPFGEWDLKGNAKLPEYCKCFNEAYTVRAKKALAAMQAGTPPDSLEKSNKEELDLRNVCRKKVGLPLAVEPK